MTGFLTLVRRDIADNRGALIITPLAIALVVVVLGLIGLATGRAQFGFDPSDMTERGSAVQVFETDEGGVMVRARPNGEVVIRAPEQPTMRLRGEFSRTIQTDRGPVTVSRGADGKVMVATPDGPARELRTQPGEFRADVQSDDGSLVIQRDAEGRTTVTTPDGERAFDGSLDPDQKHRLERAMAFGTSLIGAVPVGVAAIVILFLLAGSLYEERKDRSILFWKSMPVSDLSTVIAKLVSIVGVGLLVAAATAVVLHVAVSLMAYSTLGQLGIKGVSLVAILGKSVELWGTGLMALVVYIGWALPVYAWIVLASAISPKAPFIAAFVPLGAIPAIAAMFDLNSEVLAAPLRRLIGFPVVEGTQGLTAAHESHVPVGEIAQAILSGLAKPTFWLGLAIAAALVWAASEVRRRRAF